MNRVFRLLRSRRLAVWTIVALVAYVAIATFLSESAYRFPGFLALLALLTLETAACALERTQRALKAKRSGTMSRSELDVLKTRPQMVVPVPKGAAPADVVEGAFGVLKLKTTRSERLAEGRSGTFALLGSPLFHWTLVLLFMTIAGGRLLRAEGLMGVVLGSEKVDVAGSYGRLDEGILHGEMSGYTIAVTEMPAEYVANGVDQGPTPYVMVSDPGGSVLAEGYVHANSPLRYGPMLIHMNDWGLAAVISVGPEDGGVTEELLLDLDDTRPSGVIPVAFSVTDASGQAVADVLVDAAPGAAGEAQAAVTIAPPGADFESAQAATTLMSAGDEIELSGGTRLAIERLTRYARLSVVDDPSVPLIYALFAIAVASLSVALLVPTRIVRVLTVDAANGEQVLHVWVRRSRSDRAFPSRVERELHDACVP